MSDLNKQISELLDEQQVDLAVFIAQAYYQQYPEIEQRYGARGKKACIQDIKYHLTYLSEAIAAGHPSFFGNYIAWAKVLLSGMNIPSEDLAQNLQVMRTQLEKYLNVSENEFSIINEYIAHGLDQLPALPSQIPSFIQDSDPHAELAQEYLQYLLRGERQIASRLILDAVENKGVNVKEIYLNVFQYAQYEIGRLWQMNKISVAQEHYCTAATQLIMSQLYSYIFSTERQGKAMVATCVGGDLHELGVRMVADFFEMDGWDTYYLGANTPSSSIMQELKLREANLLAISVTMTFHLRAAEALIAAVRADAEHQNVKIMVGGHPFNLEPSLWKQIGADGYARNAQEAIEKSNELTN
ncbi:cobalamin-dependent protein [Candidatus Albibeggiatoa sp. nov. NOAA]|uniref:cobalamin-dependent protein n=1 Tax=Candidatus Albibeggiatoa sp. nov. NOAA TaxID=3162724 RepID=UPI0032FDECFA|nr:cobalamin-dependent protein [Thiotrichaceae bacterium]